MNKRNNYFENIVIGTSPLMLLVAINISKKGGSVLIIDKDKSIGGCWQVHKSKNNNFECASHLIERYPGVYKILEEYSSIKFEPLERNPIRVFKNGTKDKDYSGKRQSKELSEFVESILSKSPKTNEQSGGRKKRKKRRKRKSRRTKKTKRKRRKKKNKTRKKKNKSRGSLRERFFNMISTKFN